MKNAGYYVNVTTQKKGNSVITRFFTDSIDSFHYRKATKLRILDWGIWWRDENDWLCWESHKF